MLFAGVSQVMVSFRERGWGGFLLDLVTGILYVVVGFLMITNPAESAAGLIKRIDELSMDTSGGFWHAEGYTLPW